MWVRFLHAGPNNMAYTYTSKHQKSCSVDGDVTYTLRDPEPNAIVMHAGNNDEMIRVAPDGFYVRGVKVPADDQEAETVYNAFKQWLTWANLQRR